MGLGLDTIDDVAFKMRISIVEPARGVEMRNTILFHNKSFRSLSAVD